MLILSKLSHRQLLLLLLPNLIIRNLAQLSVLSILLSCRLGVGVEPRLCQHG